MPFRFVPLEISSVVLVEAQAFRDDRGLFMEAYKHSEFAAHGIPERFVQDNVSYSKGHVLRGLHYQKNPKAQGKLVAVLSGRVFDVAVDIRQGSPTYGRWVSVELSDARHNTVCPPRICPRVLRAECGGECRIQDHGGVRARLRARNHLERSGAGDRMAN
jgi:dTDP-4-dehydrorhamnose 3,5-epimerase